MTAGLFNALGERLDSAPLHVRWVSAGVVPDLLLRTQAVQGDAADGIHLELTVAAARSHLLPTDASLRLRQQGRVAAGALPLHIRDDELELFSTLAHGAEDQETVDELAAPSVGGAELPTSGTDTWPPLLPALAEGTLRRPAWAVLELRAGRYSRIARPTAEHQREAIEAAAHLPVHVHRYGAFTRFGTEPEQATSALALRAGTAFDGELLFVLPDLLVVGPEAQLRRLGQDTSPRLRYLVRTTEVASLDWL